VRRIIEADSTDRDSHIQALRGRLTTICGTRFCPDSQACAAKRKAVTTRPVLFQWRPELIRDSGRAMIDALRMNVTVVALLATASAINGVMFYHYL
jgi:hypothetical protein